MRRVLVSWIGQHDLDGRGQEDRSKQGPVARTVQDREFDEAVLINDYGQEVGEIYLLWLRSKTPIEVRMRHVSIVGPTNYRDIYQRAVEALEDVLRRHNGKARLAYQTSAGTPPMAAVWVLLAKTKYPADLLESSVKKGVQDVVVPFDIAAEFLPNLIRISDAKVARLLEGKPPETPEFSAILYRSEVMARVVGRAARLAPREVPVLIEGESGTGKELFALAIRSASQRSRGPFVTLNCGAIPRELIETELFGHEKGAFTGAQVARAGKFEEADGGTLFLDEVGELSLQHQVRLLRVLAESKITRVGANRSREIDVRIIAATNRNLIEEIRAGRFRQDLYYRLAVGTLFLPPLRAREADLGLLIDAFLEDKATSAVAGSVPKKLSPAARNILLAHPWPGNVRELHNTLTRAAIWADGEVIDAHEIREALLPDPRERPDEILGLPLGGDFRLGAIMQKVAIHYLARALQESQCNKTKAAELVGLPSYQTFTNWLRKYGVEG